MATMYLVALKDTPGDEEINLALRDLIEHHSHFVMPCGKVESYGPYSGNWRWIFGEIIWLLSRLSPYNRLSDDLCKELQEKARARYGSYDTKLEYMHYCDNARETIGCYDREASMLREFRKRKKNWVFRQLISPWVPNRARLPG